MNCSNDNYGRRLSTTGYEYFWYELECTDGTDTIQFMDKGGLGAGVGVYKIGYCGDGDTSSENWGIDKDYSVCTIRYKFQDLTHLSGTSSSLGSLTVGDDTFLDIYYTMTYTA